MSNSPSKNKIEKALGMSNINDLDDIPDYAEGEEKRKLEERKALVSASKSQLEDLKKNSGKDEDFIREMLKNLATTGMTMVKVMEEEMQLDVKARNVETAAEMINAVTSTLDKLQSISEHKDKMEIEKEKIDIKKNNSQNGPMITANIVAAGSMSDLLKTFRANGLEVGKVDGAEKKPEPKPVKTIDVKADVKKEGEE
jgi:hypothetical protein